MPRTSGVSSSSTVRCILLSPRPIRVARWSLVRRIGDPVWVSLIFAIVLLRHRLGLGRGGTLRDITTALEQIGDLLAATLRDRFRRCLLTQRRKGRPDHVVGIVRADRSEEHTSELQSLMRLSYAVFCLKKKNTTNPYK